MRWLSLLLVISLFAVCVIPASAASVPGQYDVVDLLASGFFPFVAFADFPDSLPLGPGFQEKTLISLCGFSPFFCCVGDFAGRVHLGSVTFFSCLPIGQSVRGMQAAPPPWPGDGPQAQRCRCVVGMAPPTVGSFL